MSFLMAIYIILSFVLTIHKVGSIFYGMCDKINEKIDVISRGGIWENGTVIGGLKK